MLLMGYAGTLGCQASKLSDAGQPRVSERKAPNVSQQPAKFAELNPRSRRCKKSETTIHA